MSVIYIFLRYLFKKALLEDDIARKEALEKKEQKDKVITEDSLKWDQGKDIRFFLVVPIQNIINLICNSTCRYSH